jgi:hypothetical protein
MKRTKHCELLVVMTFLLTSLGFAQTSPAPGVRPPDPRSIIDSGNASKFFNYVPGAAMFALQHGFQIKVVPTERLDWSEGYKQATEKYSAQVSLDNDNFIQNYVAGLPFPMIEPSDPKVGPKIAYNMHLGPFLPDDLVATDQKASTLRADGTALSVVADQEVTCNKVEILRFARRANIDPRPSVDSNPEGVEWKYKCTGYHGNGSDPASMSSAFLTIRYLDSRRADETYALGRETRRVNRYAVPSVTLSGMSSSPWAFSGPKPEQYVSRLVNTIPLLACLGAPDEPAGIQMTAGSAKFTSEPFQLRRAYQVEMTPRDPHLKDFKAVFYIDTEIYLPLAVELTEPQHSVSSLPLWRRIPAPDGGSYYVLAGGLMVPTKSDVFTALAQASGSQLINTGQVSAGSFSPASLR